MNWLWKGVPLSELFIQRRTGRGCAAQSRDWPELVAQYGLVLAVAGS